MDEVDRLLSSSFIQDCGLFVGHSVVVLNSFVTHPFQVVDRHLIIPGDKERIDVSIQPDVEIDHPTIHMDPYKIEVKQERIDHHQEKVDQDLQDHAYSTRTISLVIIVVQLEQITIIVILDNEVNNAN